MENAPPGDFFLIWWFAIAYEAIFEPNNFISVLSVVTAAEMHGPIKTILYIVASARKKGVINYIG